VFVSLTSCTFQNRKTPIAVCENPPVTVTREIQTIDEITKASPAYTPRNPYQTELNYYDGKNNQTGILIGVTVIIMRIKS